MDLNNSETTRASGGDDNQEQTFPKSSSSIRDEIQVEKPSERTHSENQTHTAEHFQTLANISDHEHARNVEQNIPEKNFTTEGEYKSRLSEQIKKMDLIKAHFHKEHGRYGNAKPLESELYQQSEDQEAKGVEQYQLHVNSSQTSTHHVDAGKIADETSRKRKVDSLKTIMDVCKRSKEEQKHASQDLSRTYPEDKKSSIYSTNEYIETEDCCRKKDTSESKDNMRKMINHVNGVDSIAEVKIECRGDPLKEDDINNESGGFDVEEMQSQRCVMAFNTYGSTSGDHKGNIRETILDVNINEISTDKQRLKRNSSSNHMILDNHGDRMGLRKRDIKVATTMNEVFAQMKEEQVSPGTSLSTEVTVASSEASDGKFLVGGDGDSVLDVDGDRIDNGIGSEEMGMDLEQLVSLYFDQQVIYTCEECEFETETKLNLICHYSANHSEDHRLDSTERLAGRWYQCALCIFKARYMKNLRLHYKFRHGYQGELYQCCHPACNHVAQFKEDLLQHYRACHVYTATALLVNRTH